ncbi:WXG100 family type VII secretion target [Listeria booriae]|uniref:WXG100 family type VII secretion target n=1 Tax=Listeria booriae TaxID=1552123 RepID=UPI001628798B|nr:WXG100 family type VII secretion target [Listeria booriae]MBC2265064.1 WXG100 family type VII secretion target [Listeria booriae]
MAIHIKINGDVLRDAVSHANQLEKGIKDAYANSKILKSDLESGSWSGEARDAFVAYFDLIYQYHTELQSTVELNAKALRALGSNIESYNNDAKVKEVRNL